MNEQASRREQALKIAANPSSYKVCEGCESIVGSACDLCPNCHSFRFDQAANRVIQQARILGNRAQQSVTAEDLH